MRAPDMGFVHVHVTLFSPDEARSETLDLLVDTGATLTWVPEDVASRLGIRPTGIRRFRIADGRLLERAVGDAILDLSGTRGYVGIAFAKPGDANVLGVTALERLGFELDPQSGSLRKLDYYLALASPG